MHKPFWIIAAVQGVSCVVEGNKGEGNMKIIEWLLRK